MDLDRIAFSPGGLRALISSVLQVKQTADGASSAVAGLGEDVAEMARLTAAELAGKQDKPTAVSVTIPATGWGSDSTAGYPKYYDISAAGVTARDRADIVIAPAGMSAAKECGLCPVCETLAEIIRVRAERVPAAAIAAAYWLEQGKE